MKLTQTEHVGSGANRIVIDLDGTLIESTWPGLGDWLPGAVSAVRRLIDLGYEVVIQSVRFAPTEVEGGGFRDTEELGECLAAVARMFKDAGIGDVKIWTHSWKPGAIAYIDDKGIHYDGREDSWERILDLFEEAKEVV